MTNTNKQKLADILQTYLPKEMTKKQLIDWLVKMQVNNANFFTECTVIDLVECANEAGIKLVKNCKPQELEIPIFNKRKKINCKPKTKIPKFIGKCDIIEVYINQNKTHKETCKILHISSNRLQLLCKEYNIYKQKAC